MRTSISFGVQLSWTRKAANACCRTELESLSLWSSRLKCRLRVCVTNLVTFPNWTGDRRPRTASLSESHGLFKPNQAAGSPGQETGPLIVVITGSQAPKAPDICILLTSPPGAHFLSCELFVYQSSPNRRCTAGLSPACCCWSRVKPAK
jgi:hypothetical protein